MRLLTCLNLSACLQLLLHLTLRTNCSSTISPKRLCCGYSVCNGVTSGRSWPHWRAQLPLKVLARDLLESIAGSCWVCITAVSYSYCPSQDRGLGSPTHKCIDPGILWFCWEYTSQPKPGQLDTASSYVFNDALVGFFFV